MCYINKRFLTFRQKIIDCLSQDERILAIELTNFTYEHSKYRTLFQQEHIERVANNTMSPASEFIICLDELKSLEPDMIYNSNDIHTTFLYDFLFASSLFSKFDIFVLLKIYYGDTFPKAYDYLAQGTKPGMHEDHLYPKIFYWIYKNPS
ncbi:unnamed protein product [Didymodactylos carnosus]|uniref:Uncharacterized protein n=1 Tax=Didymodactylos carnosus TaxID=1234261 RepID=A0A8S2PYA2_9BILA|nr:unnamed protein product [Didymodactylos carnosus]CAF4076358.1 unnamed protein product [Didymodactylos carnosus]